MKNIFCIILASSLMVACKKDEKVVTPPVPSYLWSSYMGTYDVYDTVNHKQWVMKMTHVYHSDYNNGNNDSIYLENFANKFSVRYKWMGIINQSSQQPGFGLGPFHPIKDYNGLRWHLDGWGDDPTTNKEENMLKNDSIILYFNQSNIAFYQTDGVSYYACTCKHIAVKRK